MSTHGRPRITAEVTFLGMDEGGRVTAPLFVVPARYMPHIVVQSRDVRKAVVDADGVSQELYQGVAFVAGPHDFKLGDTSQFVLELMYYPELRYEDVRPGATFTVREGGKVVAHGVVLSRSDPEVTG